MKALMIVALLVVANEAMADSPISQNIKLGNGTQAGAAAGAWADSSSSSVSSSVSNGGNGYGGLGGSGGLGMGGAGGLGGVGQGGAANNMGNSQSVGFSTPHQAPAVFMGAAMPTAICQKPVSGFLSLFIFGGAGASSSITYDDCMRLEVGRSFRESGRPDLAVKMACLTEYGRELKECAE